PTSYPSLFPYTTLFRSDPLIGSEKDFRSLCRSAHKLGISVVLDGVFSHTGCDSKYFNMYSHYNCVGAYNSKESPYYSWYKFTDRSEEHTSELQSRFDLV